MAALNNRGVIHYDMGEYSLCQEYLDDMIEFIGTQCASASREDIWDRNLFLLNALCFAGPLELLLLPTR